jgi:hypothetical protein
MHSFAAAGAAFLIAVLWFDLMFDVQARRGGETLPDDVLASIRAYYRRVTSQARPMGALVSLVMMLTVVAIIAEIVTGVTPRWLAWVSLVLAGSAIGLALARTVLNARRLGAGQDAASVQTALARGLLGDHLYCLAAMAVVLALQLFGPA